MNGKTTIKGVMAKNIYYNIVGKMTRKDLKSILVPEDIVSTNISNENSSSLESVQENDEPNTIDEYFDLLQEIDGLDV